MSLLFRKFCCWLTVLGFLFYWPTIAVAEDGSTAGSGLFDVVFSGGIIGLSIVTLLLALSLTSAYLVFEQILLLRRNELIPDAVNTRIRELLSEGKWQEIDALCREQKNLLTFVVQHGLAELDGGWAAVEKSLENALAEQAAKLLRKIEYLSVIGNIAPMIGLLGTVTGMVFAFQKVATTQGAAGAGELAEGIYQALVTTIGGLIVAIPSLAAFAILRNRVDQLIAEAAYVVQNLFRPIKRRMIRRNVAASQK